MLPRLSWLAGRSSTARVQVRVCEGRSRVGGQRTRREPDGEPEADNARCSKPCALWLCGKQTPGRAGAMAYAGIVTDTRDSVGERAGSTTCECVSSGFGGRDDMTQRSADCYHAVPTSRDLRMGLASRRLWR